MVISPYWMVIKLSKITGYNWYNHPKYHMYENSPKKVYAGLMDFPLSPASRIQKRQDESHSARKRRFLVGWVLATPYGSDMVDIRWAPLGKLVSFESWILIFYCVTIVFVRRFEVMVSVRSPVLTLPVRSLQFFHAGVDETPTAAAGTARGEFSRDSPVAWTMRWFGSTWGICLKEMSGWLVVSNLNFIFHFIYGMSSFPLTNIFQDD